MTCWRRIHCFQVNWNVQSETQMLITNNCTWKKFYFQCQRWGKPFTRHLFTLTGQFSEGFHYFSLEKWNNHINGDAIRFTANTVRVLRLLQKRSVSIISICFRVCHFRLAQCWRTLDREREKRRMEKMSKSKEKLHTSVLYEIAMD